MKFLKMANYKLLTLNVRGQNKSRKRRQLFRWLHQQQSDIIFLQETYSSLQTIKTWEAEWGRGGGKIVSSHGSTHSRGVTILFKPRLDVSFEKIIPDKHRRYSIAEVTVDGKKIVYMNIYAPNEPKHRAQFFSEISNSYLKMYANENIVLAGEAAENLLMKTHSLVDAWRFKNPQSFGFTWSNPSMKIQCGLDYFLVSKHLNYLINVSRILRNIYSDHSAVSLSISFDETSPSRGPGFWKFNNSFLSDNYYVKKLIFLISQAALKYKDVKDKGLYWEMIKMEIRAFTIKYSKQKAKATRNEEKRLRLRLEQLQESLGKKYSDTEKAEMNKIKTKLEKISAFKTRGTIIRNRARWYELGEKNSDIIFYTITALCRPSRVNGPNEWTTRPHQLCCNFIYYYYYYSKKRLYAIHK